MHLQQHAGIQLLFRKRGRQADHRTADDIGRRTLNRRIDGGALGTAAQARVFRSNLADMHPAPEQGFDIAMFAREGLGLFHVIANARKTLKIFLDVLIGLTARDAELIGKAEGGDAVDDAEIDRLGPAADFGRHALDRHTKNLRRGHGMNVEPIGKGVTQCLDTRDMGKQPQFDLAVIGADQQMPLLGDESGADAAAFFGADRDVLQIGIGRGQTPGRGGRHRVRGMNAPGLRIDVTRQGIGIGAAQFRQLAPVQHLFGDVMALGRQILQHIGIGGPGARLGFTPAGQREFSKQHIAQLPGRADVELFARELVDIAFERSHLNREIMREFLQHPGVDGNAGLFHIGKNGHQRAFQRFVNRKPTFRRKPRLQKPVETQCDIGIFRRITRRLLHRYAIEGDLLFALARDIGEGDGLVAEIKLRQLIHAVAVQGCFQHIRDQHRIVEWGDADAPLQQNQIIIFQVLCDFQHALIFQQRFEARQHRLFRQLFGCAAAAEIKPAAAIVAARDVTGLIRRHRERDTAKYGLHRIERGGFGIDTNRTFFARARDPMVQPVECGDRFIAVVIDRLQKLSAIHHGAGSGRSGSAGRFLHRLHRRLAGGCRNCCGRRNASTSIRQDRICVFDPVMAGGAAGQRAELHRLQERDQGRGIGFAHIHFG